MGRERAKPVTRSNANSTGRTVCMVLPSRPFWHRRVLFTFLALLWPWLEWRLVADFRTEWMHGHARLLTFFGCTLVGIGGAVLYVFYVWMLFGREVVRVTTSRLELRNEVGRLGWSRSFESGRIGTIHLTPPAEAGWHNARHDPIGYGAFKDGEVEFDYDATPYRFGVDLSRDEAKQLLHAIAEVLPNNTIVEN